MAYRDLKGERDKRMPESGGRAQVSGAARRETRAIWRKLDLRHEAPSERR
jgi:hypothetical protein